MSNLLSFPSEGSDALALFKAGLTASAALIRLREQHLSINIADFYSKWTGFDRLSNSTKTADPYLLTDSGNAEFFASEYQGIVRYDHARRTWMIFDGHHWREDRTAGVERLSLDSIRARVALGIAHNPDDDKRKALLKWGAKSEGAAHRRATVTLAAPVEGVAVSGDEWDRDPWLIGVANGVVDLRTGERRDGRPEDGITKVLPVAFNPDAQCPRWERFIQEIFAGHTDLADYMHRVIGYSATGATTEQVFWILYGSGSNGKSTFIETLHRVLGPHMWTMPFPSSSWSDSMGEYQKASLMGRRFVTSSEVKRRGELNEELVKSLTGGDMINARHPYGRPIEFTPEAKFFLRVNEPPIIRDETHGMWRRLKLIPFKQTFAVDTTLADTLAGELEGILAWIVRGTLAWQRDGLQEPSVVREATASYRQEMDSLSDFIDEGCVLGDEMQVRATDFYDAYVRWCKDAGARDGDRLKSKAFGEKCSSRFRKKHTNRGTVYFGVGLRVRAAEQQGLPDVDDL